MQRKIEFVVPVQPLPQGRPRARRIGAGIQIYNPVNKKMKEYREKFVVEAEKVKPVSWDETAPFELIIHFRFGAADNPTQHLGLPVPFVKRPDLDNLVKPVQDALNGILWEDDSQIINLVTHKYYTAVESVTPRGRRVFFEPEVVVVVNPLETSFL